MNSVKRTFKLILMLALLFLMLISINIGCANGAAPEEEWNKTFGGNSWGEISSIQQTIDGGYILAGYRWLNGDYDYLLVKTDSNGNEQWSKTFDGTEDNYASFVQQTIDGGYIIANTYTHIVDSGDFWLVKTDSNGNEQWNKTYVGSNWLNIYSVQQTTDGGYILAGERWSYSDRDLLLMKIDLNGNEQWSKTIGGTERDCAYSIQQTSDGGYIITGETYSYSSDYWSDFWIVKTDSNGNEQWNKTFAEYYDEEACSVQQTTDGGYIIAGSTDWYSTGGYDFSLKKIDSNGNEQWNKTFGGSNGDFAYSVQQTTDGGYIIAGYTYPYGADKSDFCLVKTDSNGNEQWNKTFGGINSDSANTVQQTTDDGYIIAGRTYSYGVGYGNFWVVKTDLNGNEQWNKTFGGTAWEDASSVQQTTDGGYIIVGYTYSYGAGCGDSWLVKTDSNGNEQWNKTFGGTNRDWANSVQQTIEGGYIFAGSTCSYGAGYSDSWLVKTDSNGNEQWNETFGGTAWEEASSVQQTIDGGYIIAGYTSSYDVNEGDFWLVKTDLNGNEQWNKTFGGIYEDKASSVQQTTDGGYIIAGYIHYDAGMADSWLVKTDSNGNKQWDKTFTKSYGDWAYSVQQTSDSGYIIAGITEDDNFYEDIWLIKTDSNGNEQWNETFGGNSRDYANSVQQTIDGGYIIAGSTQSYSSEYSYYFWLVKTDSNGNEQWNETFGGTDNDFAQSIQQTTDGGYIIAGSTESYSAGGKDFWVIKVGGNQINDNWKNEWIGEDSEGGGAVTTVELQKAIHHWLEDIPVRGHIMSSTDLQEIIAIWLSG
ncbi:MAG: hypothetical protein K8R25_17645 [Methanosarcinales archaeon]|nr:hypothetical protein [Methanosarcinales archaeon]